MKIEITVCDVCQDRDAPTQHFEIKNDAGKAGVDLCEAHSQPVLGLMGAVNARQSGARRNGSRSPSATTTPVRKQSPSRVVTLEDIERMKQAEKQ